MLKIGLIGCGGIAPAHIWAYKQIKDVDVVALCDLDIDKANNLARQFGISSTYENYWDMIESNELDSIDVCTPIPTHVKIVCDIAKAVPAIFLEKPMALNVSECDEIINSLNKYDTKCCINHLQLFSPLIQKINYSMENGQLDLFSLKLTQKESYEYLNSIGLAAQWNVSERHGGIIWEVCSHLGYLQLHFLPDINEVYALGGKSKYEAYDNFCVLLKTPDDKFGVIELNWVSKETEVVYEFTEFNGKRTKIYFWENFITEHTIKPPQTISNVINNLITDELRFFNKWVNFSIGYLSKFKLKPMYNIINEYVFSLKNDGQMPVSPEDGRKLINLLESIKKSLKLKKPVIL